MSNYARHATTAKEMSVVLVAEGGSKGDDAGGGEKGRGERPAVRATLLSLDEDSVQCFLLYLDAKSLAMTRASNKRVLLKAGDQVAKLVARHLHQKFFAKPLVDDDTLVIYNEMMWRLSREVDEVLVMGGFGSAGCGEDLVTKVLIESRRKGSSIIVCFGDGKPLLHPRMAPDIIVQAGKALLTMSNATVERLDALTHTPSHFAQHWPNDLRGTTTVVLDGVVFLLGGTQNSWPSDVVYTLKESASASEESLGQWLVHEAKLKTRRSQAAAISFQGKIFLAGGVSGPWLRSVESFDPVSGDWHVEEEEMTKERCCFSLFVYQEELYAVGGDWSGMSTTIEKRNKHTKQWQLVADCGQNRQLCAAALVGNNVFLFGGIAHQTSFNLFNLQSIKWATQDHESTYFDESSRKLPRPIWHSSAVNITPSEDERNWSDISK